jgi:mannose/fructose/N-acetylgalactosamine-specific phosphotransferase system component IIB
MRYYLGPSPNSVNSAIDINKIIVGSIFNQRENDSKNKIIVMSEEDISTHPSMSAFKEKTYDEILIEIAKPEWHGEMV